MKFLGLAFEYEEAAKLSALKWPSARLGSIEVRPIEPGLSTEARYD